MVLSKLLSPEETLASAIYSTWSYGHHTLRENTARLEFDAGVMKVMQRASASWTCGCGRRRLCGVDLIFGRVSAGSGYHRGVSRIQDEAKYEQGQATRRGSFGGVGRGVFISLEKPEIAFK